MNKVYLIISCSGEYEEYTETVVKAFQNIKKAESYVTRLENGEQERREKAEKCRECSGYNVNCPFYSVQFKDGECEFKEFWHDNQYFRIDEVELVE